MLSSIFSRKGMIEATAMINVNIVIMQNCLTLFFTLFKYSSSSIVSSVFLIFLYIITNKNSVTPEISKLKINIHTVIVLFWYQQIVSLSNETSPYWLKNILEIIGTTQHKKEKNKINDNLISVPLALKCKIDAMTTPSKSVEKLEKLLIKVWISQITCCFP